MSVRRFLTPAWLGLHAVAIILFTSFLAFGWWQLARAQGGNDRSWGYTFEWPVFAIFIVVMWIKMVRDELADAAKPPVVEDLETEPVRPPTELELIKEAEAENPDLAAYNRYLSRLNSRSR
jgi:DNA-binding transcriptional regulator of glucitol operon